jgi:hypothetical protein
MEHVLFVGRRENRKCEDICVVIVGFEPMPFSTRTLTWRLRMKINWNFPFFSQKYRNEMEI